MNDLAVTPNGDIYPCHQFVGNDDFKLANIMDEEIVIPQEISNMFRDAHVYSKEDCKKCWNKFYCSGGCHANAINFNNDIRKPYELGCEMQKKKKLNDLHNDSSKINAGRRIEMIKGFKGIKPTIDDSAFVAETADIIGDVIVEKNASIWYKAVLRGDDSPIIVGENSNVQDGTIVHCGEKDTTVIGKNVTIGHAAIIHGCKIGDYSLIGMGSTVLDNAEIERSLWLESSLVTGKKFPPGVLLLGSPAKVVRELTDAEKESLKKSALHYVEMGKKHK